MIQFKMLDTRYDEEALGLIPHCFSRADGRSAKEQVNEHYAHGGGWFPQRGWRMGPVGELLYSEDPNPSAEVSHELALFPIAIAMLGNEAIRVYPHAWVSITQEDGSFEVSRMD